MMAITPRWSGGDVMTIPDPGLLDEAAETTTHTEPVDPPTLPGRELALRYLSRRVRGGRNAQLKAEVLLFWEKRGFFSDRTP